MGNTVDAGTTMRRVVGVATMQAERVDDDFCEPKLKETTVTEFERELSKVINKTSKENESNTPDFILAQYMKASLDAFNAATQARDAWYKMSPHPGLTTRTVNEKPSSSGPHTRTD